MSSLWRSKRCFIGISVCEINQATVFWQNSNEGEWIVINSFEGANHGALPHSSQPILSLATVTDRGCCVKTVNCHFSDDGHLDGSERLRSAVYGLGAIWAQTSWVWLWPMHLDFGIINSSVEIVSEGNMTEFVTEEPQKCQWFTISFLIGSDRSLTAVLIINGANTKNSTLMWFPRPHPPPLHPASLVGGSAVWGIYDTKQQCDIPLDT